LLAEVSGAAEAYFVEKAALEVVRDGSVRRRAFLLLVGKRSQRPGKDEKKVLEMFVLLQGWACFMN